MAKLKQLTFEGFKKRSDTFGGSLLGLGNPKQARPLDSKYPIHLVLRSNKSQMRLFKTLSPVNEAVREICRKHGVKIYDYANVGNHLHLCIKLRAIRDWSAFIRELTGRLAQISQRLGARDKSPRKFWKTRPFTRIVRSWQKAYRTVLEYIELNRLEAEGFINRKEIKTMRELKALLAFEDW